MNLNATNVAPFETVESPDLLAGGVLNSLGRQWGDYGAWRAIKTLIIGGITFGLAPLVLWPRRFREFVVIEQQQLWHLAEWLRVRGGSDEARELRDAAERIRFRPALWMISLIAAAYPVVLFFLRHGPVDESVLLGATYYRLPAIARQWQGVFDPECNFAWTMGLTLAYAMHWIQVHAHVSDVRRFVERFNQLVDLEQIPSAPMPMPELGWGFGPLWLLAAGVLMSLGAVWALPMMLAGAVHRRYITRTSAALRRQMAQHVRAILLHQRPAMRVAQPVWLKQLCDNPLCRATIATDINFCSRCGTRTGSAVNAVA